MCVEHTSYVHSPLGGIYVTVGCSHTTDEQKIESLHVLPKVTGQASIPVSLTSGDIMCHKGPLLSCITHRIVCIA